MEYWKNMKRRMRITHSKFSILKNRVLQLFRFILFLCRWGVVVAFVGDFVVLHHPLY